MPTDRTAPATVFYSYSHKDERLRRELEAHLALLRREGLISERHDRQIPPGEEWQARIDENMKSADVILLLVSAEFIASEYCWSNEMSEAIERHNSGTARVIPVIVRPVDWSRAVFGKLQALPKNAKPITLWSNRDLAWVDVAQGIRAAVAELRKGGPRRGEAASAERAPAEPEMMWRIGAIPKPPVYTAHMDYETGWVFKPMETSRAHPTSWNRFGVEDGW